jgi:raffinose/stachyose/melibiose transport system substrate-binding protein
MRFLGRGESPRASLPFRALLAVIALAAAAVALSACGSGGDDSGSGDQQGVVEITCGTVCGRGPDPLVRAVHAVTEAFNAKYRGTYHIRSVEDAKMRGGSNDRQSYYQRLALAGDLPDLFHTRQAEALLLGRTGKLVDFAPLLEQDGWGSNFHDGALSTVTNESGHTWAVPLTRDTIGIYWNRAIFREAGVSEFPRTWDEVNAACEKIKAIGKSCFAMDGLWTTLLMWANMIGTQPGGADFLTTGIRTDDWSTFPEVVRATEMLKQWHVEGFTNRDAFSGEYQNAATAFIRGQAAMIANGPWMVGSDIRTKNAIKGLYDEVGYEISPGWTAGSPGAVVVSGESSFSSASTDKRKQEAVVAFLKFFETHAQSYGFVTATGSYPAVKFEPTAAERKTLEPLSLGLSLRSAEVPTIYPHALANTPASIITVFPNLWPAYVRGDLDTKEFLSKLPSDLQSKTG